MSNSRSALACLLGEHHSDFLSCLGSHSVFCAQTDLSNWPQFLLHEMWTQLRLLDPACPGTVDVTRGHIAQYRIDGVPASRCVEDLNLAVRIPELRSKLPEADTWAHALEGELRLPPRSLSLSAFVNPAGVGLGAHCDPVEHLLIHVAGEKHIRILPNPAGANVTASHALPQTPRHDEYLQYSDGLPDWDRLPSEAREIRLRPGSVLLLPRGVFHETIGGASGPSATVVVQFKLPNYADVVLDYLRPYLMQDARWRCPVPNDNDDGSADATLAGLLDELGRRIPAVSRNAIRSHRLHGEGSTFGPNTRLMRNPSVFVDFDTRGIRITPLRGKGPSATFKLGPDALDAIQRLLQTKRPTSCAELTARFDTWEEASLQKLLRFLVRQEVLLLSAVEAYKV